MKRSPWISHYNASSCNGCDLEILACLTPRYDVERLGIVLRESPRHADILLVSGVVNMQNKDRLKRVYGQMAKDKYVIAIGACGISGGPFHEGWNMAGPVDKVIPVDMYVPGCPPRPESIINAIAKLLEGLE